jgi:hypothetical protein
MFLDHFNSWSVSGFRSQHSIDQVLEVFTVEVFLTLLLWLILFMGLPEDISSSSHKELVVRVGSGVSLGERWSTTDHDEEDNTTGEEIYSRAAVWLSEVDFRSHVGFSTQDGVEFAGAIFAGHEGSETEVSDFKVEVGVEEKVFGLQVSVGDALFIAVVKSFNKGSEVSSGGFLREFAGVGDVFEEFTSRNELHDDGNSLVGLAVLLDIVSGISKFDKVDDVGVVESRKDFDFLLDGLEVKTWVRVLDDLNSAIFVDRRSITQLDFRVVAASESLDKNVFAKTGVLVFEALLFHVL